MLTDPPRITQLRPTNRDPHRLTVKVDGRAVGTLSEKLIADLGLAVGQTWTDALAEQLAGALKYDKAFRAATRRLARKAMSRGGLELKLRQVKEPAPPEVITQVLDRLAELDLLDDEAYGRALIRDLTRSKPAGPALIKQKLYAQRLDRELIDRLVAESTPPKDDQREDALAYARKKQRAMAHLPADTQKRRLQGQLARRGFPADVVFDVLNSAIKAADEDHFD